jgi:hypothetical protein
LPMERKWLIIVSIIEAIRRLYAVYLATFQLAEFYMAGRSTFRCSMTNR